MSVKHNIPKETWEHITGLRETWHRRSEKWHGRLDTERAWLSRGVSAPVLFGALASLAVALLLLLPVLKPYSQWAALCAPVMTVIAALVSWRANAARTQLDAGKIDEAWVIADRMATHYDGLVVRLQAMENPALIRRESQIIESAARFGLPEALRNTLAQSLVVVDPAMLGSQFAQHPQNPTQEGSR